MAENSKVKFDKEVADKLKESEDYIFAHRKYNEGFAKYDLQTASNAVWELISNTDKIVQDRQPFKKIKTDKAGAELDIKELLARLYLIGELLYPILPVTASKIIDLVKNNKMPEVPLFARK